MPRRQWGSMGWGFALRPGTSGDTISPPPPGGSPTPPIVAPDDISGLCLWTDPSDTARSTIISGEYSSLESSDTGVGRSVGDQVWTAPGASNRPPATTINGRAAMLFDGSSDYMRLYTNGGVTAQAMLATGGMSHDGMVNSQSVTVIAVLEPLDGTVGAGYTITYNLPGMLDFSSGYGPGFYIWGTAALNNLAAHIYKFTNPGTGDHYINNATNPGLPVAGPSAMWWRQADPGASPATSELYGEISVTATPQTASVPIEMSYQTYWTYKPMYLGYGYSQYGNCKVGEICVWDRSLSDAEVASLGPYFTAQWGV